MQEFYKGKRILVTGHTGFKGAWLCTILKWMGAEVIGYSLNPPTEKNLYDIAEIKKQMHSLRGDIRDFGQLKEVFEKYQPEIVFHLAAQPLVRESYQNPRYTYETNVMGTVNLLECIRVQKSVKSVLNVTTDKVYKNKEWFWGYRENEVLDGYDPYSNSKSCSELITNSYKRSFFDDMDVRISTARAGNVIGGGDFAKDRIIPDCIRAAEAGKSIEIRNPNAVRPFQHVIEPLMAYLIIAKKQWNDSDIQGSYNVGPDEANCVTTGELANIFCECWGNGMKWVSCTEAGPHEANFLKLDCSKIKKAIGWKPVWDIWEAIERTVEWEKEYQKGSCMNEIMTQSIEAYLRRI